MFAERHAKRALRDASQTPQVLVTTLFVKLYKLRKRGILLSLGQPFNVSYLSHGHHHGSGRNISL